MNIINWVLIGCIGIVVVITFCVTLAHFVKDKKKKKESQPVAPAQQPEKKEQPSEAEQKPEEQPTNVEVTLEKQDIIISAHQTIIASKNGTLRPGKYSILSGDSGVDAFNVRIGKFVKEYKHGDVVVIANGEEVTPTSHKIILR